MSSMNLFGGLHDHDFSVPWRGYLMCSDDWCAEVRTTDGALLTEEQQDALHSEILSDWS